MAGQKFLVEDLRPKLRWVGMLRLIVGIGHPIFTAYLLNYIGDGMLSANLILTIIPVFFWVDGVVAHRRRAGSVG